MKSHVLSTYFEDTASVKTEFDNIVLQVISGQVPKDLSGTLFRNGNGRFVHQGVPYRHLFDGDGMITKIQFEKGSVSYSNRYVRTQEFDREEKEGRMLFRNFGTNIPGGFLKNFLKIRFKNAANTSIVSHAGKYLALWEGGLPHLIDPQSLETLARYDYDGVLLNPAWSLDKIIAPELSFSAHPKVHEDGELYNFGTTPGVKNRLVIFRVDQGGKAEICHEYKMSDLCFTHDFILTDQKKKVFFITPVSFQLFKTFLGFKSPVEAIQSRPSEQVSVLVFDEMGHLSEFKTDFTFIFHFVNGYEEGNHIIIDGLAMEQFPDASSTVAVLDGDADAIPVAYLRRYTIDMASGRVSHESISKSPMELPAINPIRSGKSYRYSWSISRDLSKPHKYLDAIIKMDMSTMQEQLLDLDGQLPSEPVFVPRSAPKAEDDGWLILTVFDSTSHQSKVLVVDAVSMLVVCELLIPHNPPLGFHGFWEAN